MQRLLMFTALATVVFAIFGFHPDLRGSIGGELARVFFVVGIVLTMCFGVAALLLGPRRP